MDKIGIRTIVVNFDDEQLPYMSLVQGDAKTRGFDIVICDSDGKEIPPNDDYIVELVATGSNAPDKPYANRHTIKDGKYRVMIPTEALSESGFVFLQLVFYQKSTGAVIHTIEQKCPVYRSRGQEVVESNNLYVDITALRLGLERIDELDGRYENMLGEEKIRQDAEKKRNEHEANRIRDEKTRESNETIRESAEDKRVSSETTRASEEEVRKSNEIKRENNEDVRIENENKRVTAEEEREIKFDSWDKTMEGIIPNATDTEKGVVKISSLDSESEPYTAVSIGKLEEVIAPLLFNSNIPFFEIVDNKFYMRMFAQNIEEMVKIEEDEEKMSTLLNSKNVRTLTEPYATVTGDFIILKGMCTIWGDGFESELFRDIDAHQMMGHDNLFVNKIEKALDETVHYYDLDA